MAKNLKTELQSVSKELKALTKKIEKIAAAAVKVEKAKPVKAKKATAKKTAAPKGEKPSSAIDAVLNVIRRSRKEVSIEALKEKTGFQGQKLHNIVYILKKQGKIKSETKGSYTKA